jgi:pimeloyl-ACP methyl ester carboxylesterase
MPYLTARGTRFHVIDLGEPREAPVVMLHGLFTGSAASWYFTAAPALSRRHHVRLIDWRGHGLSERTPSGYDSAAMAADLAALTAELPPFAVVGHSYGAVVAVRFALAQPGRVTRIALIDPFFTRGAWLPPAGARPLLEQTTLLADLDAEPPMTEDELARLGGLPVLTVTGSRSPFRDSVNLVARALPHARRHVLDGGHDVHISAKDRLIPLLVEFLGDGDA